jgi:chromosome segregation ATPase
MKTDTPRTDKIHSGKDKEFRDNLTQYRFMHAHADTIEKELAAVTEQRDGLRSCIDYASDQLSKVTEQMDKEREIYGKLYSAELTRSNHYKQQCDRLVEALEHSMKHMRHSLNCPAKITEGLHPCNCQMEWAYDNATEAIQSLTPNSQAQPPKVG